MPPMHRSRAALIPQILAQGSVPPVSPPVRSGAQGILPAPHSVGFGYPNEFHCGVSHITSKALTWPNRESVSLRGATPRSNLQPVFCNYARLLGFARDDKTDFSCSMKNSGETQTVSDISYLWDRILHISFQNFRPMRPADLRGSRKKV